MKPVGGGEAARGREQLLGDDPRVGAGALDPCRSGVAGNIAGGDEAFVGVRRAQRGGGDDLFGSQVGPVLGVAQPDLRGTGCPRVPSISTTPSY